MRPVRAAVAVAVAIAVLGGCSRGEPANETLPDAAPSSSETSEALPPLGPPDLPMPAEAREQTAAGAEAALRYYLDLISHQAGKSGQPLRDLSQDCDLCTLLADRYDADAAAGYSIVGGGYVVESFSPPAVQGEIAEFALSVTQEAVTVTGPDGTPVADRGSPELSAVSLGASMSWSASQRAWILNQLVRNT